MDKTSDAGVAWNLRDDYTSKNNRSQTMIPGGVVMKDQPSDDLWCIVTRRGTDILREYVETILAVRRKLTPFLMAQSHMLYDNVTDVDGKKMDLIAVWRLIEGEWVYVDIEVNVEFVPVGDRRLVAGPCDEPTV